MTSLTGPVYKTNSKGPITEPCGTPQVRENSSDLAQFMTTICFRFSRYDLSPFRAEPSIPYFVAEALNQHVMVDGIKGC